MELRRYLRQTTLQIDYLDIQARRMAPGTEEIIQKERFYNLIHLESIRSKIIR